MKMSLSCGWRSVAVLVVGFGLGCGSVDSMKPDGGGGSGTAGSAGGATGAAGTSGAAGATGTAGATGSAGNTGSGGATGSGGSLVIGTAGTTGMAGSGGTGGAAGALGVAGTTGTAGTTGIAGRGGTTGMAGRGGSTGAAGATGIAGTTGTAGTVGVAGTTGMAGRGGTTGMAGRGGTTGTAGVTGTAGTTGVAGIIGTAGTTGIAGHGGTTGTAGVTGTAGTVGIAGTTGMAGRGGTTGSGGTTGTGGTGTSACIANTIRCQAGVTQTCGSNGAWQNAGASVQLLGNPNFDTNAYGWIEDSGAGYPLVTTPPIAAQTSPYVLWEGGYDNASDDCYQTVTIPAGTTSISYSFYYLVGTNEDPTAAGYDFMDAYIFDPTTNNGQQLLELSNVDDNGSTLWQRFSTSLPTALAGQSWQFGFITTTDTTNFTNFFVDTVSLSVSACSATAASN